MLLSAEAIASLSGLHYVTDTKNGDGTSAEIHFNISVPAGFVADAAITQWSSNAVVVPYRNTFQSGKYQVLFSSPTGAPLASDVYVTVKVWFRKA